MTYRLERFINCPGPTIAGGGPYVEAPPGHVGASDLRYTVRLGA